MDDTTATDVLLDGQTRRTVLTRAVLLAGTAAWAAPTVQVLSMRPASADAASDGCTPPPATAAAAARTVDLTGPVSTSGPAGSVTAAGPSTDQGDGGPAPLSFDAAGVGIEATALWAHTAASILQDPAAANAQSLATATVERLVLTLPGGVTVTLTALVSTATARVTSAGVPSSERTSSVGTVRVQAPSVDVTLNGPGPGTHDVAGLVRLIVGESQDGPGVRAVSTTVTALRLQTLQEVLPLPAVDLVVARSTAQAAFPACEPTP